MYKPNDEMKCKQRGTGRQGNMNIKWTRRREGVLAAIRLLSLLPFFFYVGGLIKILISSCVGLCFAHALLPALPCHLPPSNCQSWPSLTDI